MFQKETVLRLFENQRRQKTDEFTQWCNEALSKLQSSVDSMSSLTSAQLNHYLTNCLI
jgi:hypothetical protein